MRCLGVGSEWLLMRRRVRWTFHGLPVDHGRAGIAPRRSRALPPAPGARSRAGTGHRTPRARCAPSRQGLTPGRTLVALDAAPRLVGEETGHRQEPGQVRCDRGGRRKAMPAAPSAPVRTGSAAAATPSRRVPPGRTWQFHCARPPAPRSDRLLPDHGEEGVCSRVREHPRERCVTHGAVDDMHRAHDEFGRGACRCSSNRTLRASKNWDKARQAPPNCCQSAGSVELQAKAPEACGPPESDRGNDDSARWPLELSIDASRSWMTESHLS